MTVQELRSEHDQALREAQALRDQTRERADREGRRPFTAAESQAIEQRIERANGLRSQIARLSNDQAMQGAFDRLTVGVGGGLVRGSGASLGAQFLNGAAGRWLRETKNRGEHWETPEVELVPISAQMIGSDPTTGGIGVPPLYLPDIYALPLRPPKVAEMLTQGETVSNAVVYNRETLFTNNAAAVAEGTLKPETTSTYELVTDKVVKVAHWLPTSEELLEDFPAFRTYIDSRLEKGVQVEEDSQLVSGDGSFPNMQGLLNRTGLAPDVTRTGTELAADAIATQMSNIQSTTFLETTGVILHPADWLTILLQKDGMNRYYGNGPFMPPGVPNLWGKPCAITPAMPQGTALVVTRSAATVYRRTGLNVMMSNSHQDFFVRNQVAIRAEERLALCVMLPQAFGKVTGLTGTTTAASGHVGVGTGPVGTPGAPASHAPAAGVHAKGHKA